MKAVLLVVFTTGLSAVCLPVTGDRILGRDLAAADPQFSALPASLQIAIAPAPGVPRTFTAAELQRIAQTNDVTLSNPAGLCFATPTHSPTETEFLGSMRQSLPTSTSLSIVEMSRSPVPPGKIEFPLTGLEPPASGRDGAQLWRGFVQYTSTRRFPIWARVVVTVNYAAVVAAHDLDAERPIDATVLRIETRAAPLNHPTTAARMEDVAGRALQRPVKAGDPILLSNLETPVAVHRGESIPVEVQSGLAILRFEAIAQNNARNGGIADLRNPTTGRLFHARIEGSKAVLVVGKAPAL